MHYEAIYMGPKGSRVRFNNGELNYIEFVSGMPVQVNDEIASQLREDKQYVVRAVESIAPVAEEAAPPEKKAHLFGSKHRTTSKRA